MERRFLQKFFITATPLALFLLLAIAAHAQGSITDIGGYKLIVPLPAFGEAPKTLAELVKYLYLWAMRFVGIAAVIMVAVGGVRYVLAGGNPGKEGDAKDQITHALLGILVVLGSYLILSTINPSLVNFGPTEAAKINKSLPRDFTGARAPDNDGECLSAADLGTDGCAAIGNGWFDNAGGCAGACTAAQRCCICNLGFDCAPKAHSCVSMDDEASAPTAPDDRSVCGPYLRSDCLGRCPPSFPTCIAGNFCSNPPTTAFIFEIENPPPETGGNTVVPVIPNNPIMITVQAPSSLDVVAITVTDPNGVVVFQGACVPTGEHCGVSWESGVTGPGNYVIVAEGKDAGGTVAPGMRDTRRICGDCGPTASFEISAGTGATKCADGSFAPGPSGAARLTLNGSGSSSPGATQLVDFEWTDEQQTPLFVGPQPARVVDVVMLPGDHTVTLTVSDQYGAQGKASQGVRIVDVCL